MAVKVCRGCGCTEDQACVWWELQPGGGTIERRCSWVASDLCSECDDAGDASPLLYDAFGRPLRLAPTATPGAR
jgi:hypothetical protein